MTAPRPARLVLLLEELKFGGTQRQTLELLRGLDRSRFSPEIWCLRSGDDLAETARELEVPVHWLGRADWVTPGALLNLWRRIRAGGIDLLVLLTVVPNIWGRLFSRGAGRPGVVGTCRGGGSPRRQYERWLFPLADHLIVNTFELKDRVLASRPDQAERVSVILNGVNLERFHPPDSPPPGPPVILCVARLVPDKDHATLIKAFARLADSHPQAELWLVGAGELEEKLKGLAREMAPGRVKFQPTTLDPAPLYQRASVFVLASQKEALPNVVLEAMASGLPVAATSAGGLPEVVKHGETGLVSPVGDDTALAASLARLLDDPELAVRLGRGGRESAEKRFSLDEMVRAHQEIFQRVLAQRG